MKKAFLNIALIALVIVTAVSCKDNKETSTPVEDVAVAAETAIDYNVNTEKSQILWEGSKPTGNHNGTVKLASGALMVTNGTIEAGKFSIDMASITDSDLEGDMKANLEGHLKGTVEGKEGDFFDVTKYPFATFEMTGIEDRNGKSYVKGNLTIKEKTNGVEFPATVTMDENTITLTSEQFEIDRTKWDINFKSKSVFDDLKDNFISDEMKITVMLVANKS
jgi:polyisoprenoid-binding protein YceI